MANIRDLRKRIRTVENIKRITSAMEKIAAARLFRAKGTLTASRPYVRALTRIAGDLLASQPELAHPLKDRNAEGPVVVVLVTSDRGLCGGYNTRVIETAVEFAEKEGRDRVKFIAFGRKGASFLKRHGYEVLAARTGLPGQISAGYTEETARQMIDLYTRKEIAEAHLVITEFVSVSRHVPKVIKLLPVEPASEAGKNYMNYAYEPGAGAIAGAVLPALARTMLWNGLVESAVSEHAARMFMMQRATKNSDDVISALTLIMNKARQTAITNELTDIVGAAETIA